MILFHSQFVKYEGEQIQNVNRRAQMSADVVWRFLKKKEKNNRWFKSPLKLEFGL